MSDRATQYATPAGLAVLDFDEWKQSLSPPSRTAIESQVSRSYDPEAERKRIASRIWLAERLQYPAGFVDRNFDAAKAGYGASVPMGDSWKTEEGLNAWITSQAATERDENVMLRGYRGDTDAARQAQAAALVTIAYEAGAERQAKDPTEVYSAWVEANKLKPSFIAKNADRYWKDFNDAHAKGVEDLRVAREAAEKIFPTLAAEKHGADPADVVQYLRPLDATQQALAFRELAELSKTAGTAGKPWKDAFGELATAGGRVIEDIIRGAGNMIEDVGLMDDTSGQEDAAADQLLIRKLYEVRRGLINPIEKDTLWRKATIGAVESLPYMAAAASGIGLAAITASYTNDAQLNLQEKGIPLDKARGLAMVIGPVQGALDKLQLTMLKKAPGLNLFFQKFNTNAVALAAGRLAGVVAVEVGTELVQDPVVPAAVQELASWWDESIPGVAFSDVWGDIKEQSLDVVMATLPLALLGVGAASVRDIKAADQLSRDPEALGLLGFTPAHIKQIGAAPEGEAAAELKKLWNERAPVAKGDRKGLSYAEAAGVVAGGQTENRSDSGKPIGSDGGKSIFAPSDQEAKLNKEAGIVALRRDDNGWSVLFDDGKRVDVGTIGAAYELRAGRMMARTEKEAEGFIAVLDSLHKPGKVTTITGAAVEVEGGQITSTTPEGESTIVEKPEAALAELAAEMELLGVPRAAIGGSNMVRDGVTQITLNKTRKGALTALHESAEAVLKEGKVTDSELKAAAFVGFQLFENARNEADTKTALLLQKISLGKATATETRETMVDLAVANALGQRKDGTRFKPGALTAAVDGAIRANRDPKERRDLGRFRSFLRAVRAYMRAVFSTAAKIGKARREGMDLEALDALTDKLLGADPERAAAQDKSHARAVESEVKESFAVEAAEIPLRFDGKQKTFDGDPDLLNYTIMVPGSETTLTVEEGTTPEELQSLAREKIAQFEAGARDRGETFEVEPAFYSAAQRAIETKMPTKASAAQIIGILTNPQSRVKQEELKWSGVVPWLKGQADPVTKEAVLNYLRTDGAVKFEEVVLGHSMYRRQQIEQERERWITAQDAARRGGDHEFAEDIDREISRLDIEQSKLATDVAKYAKYQLPAGDNYREVILAMPVEKKGIGELKDGESLMEALEREQSANPVFKSSHFPDVPNYVAHMRLNDRPDAAGEPGLFIEEIQSDRHQQARQKGYKGEGGDTLKPLREAMEEARRKMVEARTAAEASVETGDIRDVSDRKLRQAYSNAWDNLERAEGEYRRAKPEGEIPDAPFRKTWPLQMFKRALRDAVAEGKKWVGWTTGATQGERFDLSKQVEAIRIENISGDGKRLAVMAIQKGRNGWTDIADNVPMEKLGDYIGKDLAKKFAEDLPNKPESQEFRGVDLKVGGEGMKGFYDSILPKEVGAYVKQWGGKVEKGEVSLPDNSQERLFNSEAEAKAWAEANLEDHEYEVQELGDGTFALYDQFTNRQVMADNVAETPIWRVEITPAMAAGVAAGQETFAVEAAELAAGRPVETSNATIVPPKGIKAFHGTPHEVDRFSLDKIGTGEGAQAYGWGLYFAENRRVAEGYQRALVDRGGTMMFKDGTRVPSWVVAAVQGGRVEETKTTFEERIKEAEEKIARKEGQYWMDAGNLPGQREILKSIDRLAAGEEIAGGSVYTVKLAVDPDELLQWDKPLSEQSAKVQEAAARIEKEKTIHDAGESDTGERLYARLLGSPPDKSEYLRNLGIPGIQYADEGSRQDKAPVEYSFTEKIVADANAKILNGSGNWTAEVIHTPGGFEEWTVVATPKKTHNLVIFDESRIEIVGRNGAPVGNLGELMAAAGETFSVEAPADSMRANWPDVWEGFPDVQWIGNTNLLTTKGGEKIQVPEYKWPVNRDWYVAKGHSGAGPTTPEEQEAAADALITRVIDADPENRQRAAAMLAFVRKHPDAILVPVRGQEKPNKHANLIPGQLARRLSRAAGNAVDETIYKVNTEGNTGKRAAERLFQPHEFAGTVEPGAKYILVDDVSTTGATAYYAARFIEGNGGRLAGVVQIGLTPRLKGEGAFSPKAFAGDEQTLRMTDATRKQLQTKAPDATLNAVVQAHGLADDWHELTDGLGRALAGNWRRASEVLAGGTAGGSALRGETGGGSVAGERPRFKSDAPKARRLTQPTLAGFESFSVEAAGMLERLADDIGRRITNPKEKLDAYARAREKFLGMARSVRFNDSVADAVTKSAIDKERRARQATREEELLNEVEADFGDLTGTEFMAAALNNPIMDAIFRKIPGRKIPAPRLRSRSAALRQGRDIGGDYDGAGELPSWIFGGTIAPDQMAAELADDGLIADAYTDTLWTAIEKALKSAGAAKSRLKDYAERKRQAREQAAKEAAAWAKGELAALPERKEQRAKSDLSRFMAALDALLVVFPPEVRAKVGGWTRLASLQTNQARADFIANRIEKIDRVFEEFLQKEYTVRMATLIARANKKAIEAGTKPTSTIGADAHYLINKMSEAMGLNETAVNGRLADLDSRIASGELSPEQEVLAMREKELVQLAGNWNSREGREAYHRKAYTDKLGKHHPAIDVPAVAEVIGADATRMAAAYLEAERTFDEGWLAWSRKIVARREARAAMRAALIADTGKSGTPVEKDERAEKDLGWRGKLKNVFLGLSSFEEAMTYGYGRESETAREFVDRERAASNAKEDAVQSIGEAVEDLFTRLAGSPFKGTQLQWKLSQKTIDAGAAGKLSELGIVQASLMWRQDDGRRHMEAFGYDAAWMAEQEKQLSNHAKAVRDFLSAQYAAEYAPLNALYRERHGVNLPGHDNYAPLTVTPMQARAGEVVDPVTGQAMGASMLTPGSLRSRSRMATAQPEFRDALQTYLGHVRQLEHWKAYFDLAVDLNAVVGNREVTNATEAAGGEQLTRVLQGWAQLFGQGGNRDAAAFLALNAELGKLSGRAAEMILFGRVGTLLIQGTQLGAALAEMPVSSYVLRMGKLFAGRLGWGDAIRSDYIQRRVSQAPPIVRQAMDALAASKPSRTKHAARQVGKLIPGADALFTAGTYAIVLDYHRSIGRKLGLRGPELDTYATRAAERATDRVAQPTRTGARSFFENTTTAPTLRASWAFASEARQKIALAAWSARSNPAQMARTLAVVWGAGGVMAAMIRAAWRDLKDDDDEDVFDEKNWSLKRLLTSAAAGPIQGVPLVGDIIEGTLFKLTGQFLPSGNMFSQAEAGATGAKKLLTGKAETPEEKLKAAKAVLFTLGLTNDSLAAASTLANIAEDAAKVVDNLEGTD